MLLRYDGSAWTRVEGARATGGMICARVAAFSPFAVGYVDTRPVFPPFPEAFVWAADETIDPVTLPGATGGDGELMYALLPTELPLGIRRNGPWRPAQCIADRRSRDG